MANYRLRIGDTHNFAMEALGGTYSLNGQVTMFSYTPASNPNDRYVRVLGSGESRPTQNGLSWSTAWTSFSPATNAAIAAGATCWVAGGNYGAVSLDWQGTVGSRKTLKKATIANHGTNTGWSDSYDTQVIFDGGSITTSALSIHGCAHITIDGQVRSGLRSGYGIQCRNAYNGIAAANNPGLDTVTIRYCDISSLPQLPPATEDSIQYKGDDLLVEYCWLHGNSSNRFQTDGHGDGIQAFGGTNLTVRYCVFENQGQHIFYGSPGFVGVFNGTIKIYYNLFYNRREFVTAGGNPYQGIVWFIDPANTAADVSHIYNNTFDMERANGFGFEQAVKLDQGSSGGANFTINCKNNAVRDSSGEGIGLSDVHTHNAFVNSGGVGECYFVPTSESNVILGTDASMRWVDPDASVPDYHLFSDSPLRNSGTNVSSIAVDANGELRDIEGNLVTNAATPDRGAFQYVP